MTDGPPRPDPVGTVAEEAAKLIALLGQRSAERPSPDPGTGESDDASYAGRAAYDSPPPADDTGREHPRAGEPLTCALCPICQGIAVLRTLQPETIDRLADLAAAAAAALRDLAAGAGAGPSSRPEPRPPGRARTVDIEVDDEEEQYP